MLLWIMHSIYAIFSIIIQKYFIENFFTVTSRTLIKYHPPPSPHTPNLPSRKIKKNLQTHLSPGRDVIIESLLIIKNSYLNNYSENIFCQAYLFYFFLQSEQLFCQVYCFNFQSNHDGFLSDFQLGILSFENAKNLDKKGKN